LLRAFFLYERCWILSNAFFSCISWDDHVIIFHSVHMV
jgi:hypothetical protein